MLRHLAKTWICELDGTAHVSDCAEINFMYKMHQETWDWFLAQYITDAWDVQKLSSTVVHEKKKKKLALTLFNRCGGGELALADAFLCNAQSWRQTLLGLHVQHQLLCTAGMEEHQNPSHSWEPEQGGGHANSLDRVPDYIHIDTLTNSR